MREYTEAELDYIRETSETLQKFVLGADEILSDMDYDNAFRFVLGISQTAQEHIATILNEVVHGKGSDEQLRCVIAHLAPACLLFTQTLYSALDSTVLVNRASFIDELARRATKTADMALQQLGENKDAH